MINLSQQVEDLMVARNPRGMQTVQAALQPVIFGAQPKL